MSTEPGPRIRRPAPLVTLDEACALPLLCLFLDRFGAEALTWSPITIHMELRDELGAEMSRENFDKLMGAIRVLTGNEVYKSLPEFLSLCQALTGGPPDGLVADCLTCALGMTEAMLINPPEEDDPSTELAPEIRAYLGYALDQEGIMSPPDVLRIATREKADPAGDVRVAFSGDPTMYAAVFGVEKEKTDEIERLVKEHVQRVLSQLRDLRLDNGDAEKIATRMLAALEGKE